MVLHSRLDDVPLPDVIYNGPLDEKIVPLVKAVQPFGLTTTGSCHGHINRFYPYPWVQLNPYDNLKLLEYLVDKSNEKIGSTVSWKFNGNILRTERKAKDISELSQLQDSVAPLSEFLFQYRPEILDQDFRGNTFRIPPFGNPVYDLMDKKVSQLMREVITLTERSVRHQNDKSLEDASREKLTQLRVLHQKERAYIDRYGDTLIIPISDEQVDRWLMRAKTLLG